MNSKLNNQTFFPFGRTMTANLESDLRNLLREFSARTELIDELTALLIAKYAEKHRFYHNLSHINALLFEAENLQKNFRNPLTIKLAVWFHDAIYEPKMMQNEIASAALAVEKLGALNLPTETIKTVERVILATQKHSADGLDADGRLFLDLDLSILGADAKIYQKYASAIRAEYSHVPQTLYKYMRKKILEHFLEREFIYFTYIGREIYETSARLNIADEIESLS